MGKSIVLLLITLGANVNAEDMAVAEMLVDRASNTIIFTDMDNAVLAKDGNTELNGQGMASSAGTKAASAPIKKAGQTSYFNTRDGLKKRLFGGANNRNSKDPAIMAKLKGKAVGMYGESKGTWYVGGGPTAWNRFNTDAQPDRQVVTPKARPRFIPNIKPVSGNAGGGGAREGTGRRIFGGTNSRNSNNPAIMARLKGKGTAMYGTMSGNTPLRIGAKR